VGFEIFSQKNHKKTKEKYGGAKVPPFLL